MITISKKQMNAFLPQEEDSIIDFIIQHLTEEHYNYIEGLPSDTLREMVGNGLMRARHYCFTELEDLTVFITWMFVMAPNFDEQPKLRQILGTASIPANERIDQLLLDHLNDSWEEAQQNYDANSWFPELKNLTPQT